MSTNQPGQYERFEVADAEAAARRIAHAFSPKSQSSVHVEAGGIGLWIAATACLVMLSCGLVGAFWMSRELSRVDTELATLRSRDAAMQAYLNAIYQSAPQLRPPPPVTQIKGAPK